jgi:hypothetical protein
MKNPMPDIIAREERIKAAVAAGVGEVGIFFFITPTETFPNSIPYTEGYDGEEFVKGPSNLCIFWRNIRKHMPTFKDVEYDKVARGRVEYSKKDQTFLIYGSTETISNQSMCQIIEEDFSLTGKKVKYIKDSQYEINDVASMVSERLDK